MHAAYVYSIAAITLIGRVYAVYYAVGEMLAAPDMTAAVTAAVLGIAAVIAITMVGRELIELSR